MKKPREETKLQVIDQLFFLLVFLRGGGSGRGGEGWMRMIKIKMADGHGLASSRLDYPLSSIILMGTTTSMTKNSFLASQYLGKMAWVASVEGYLLLSRSLSFGLSRNASLPRMIYKT